VLEFLKDRLETGRIDEIIALLKEYYKTDSLNSISTNTKLAALCFALQITPDQFDLLISQNPQTMRTIKGHAFETVFDRLLSINGISVSIVGGDDCVDRVVNGISLQLKTPTIQGSSETRVVYKTHKTHGAKSEQESLNYYSRVDDFADYLVGLVSYEPFQVVFIDRKNLPRIATNSEYIQSPFIFDLRKNSEMINKFEILGIERFEIPSDFFNFDSSKELLPLTTKSLGLRTDIIVDTILSESNFRIWDMNIRGFARELAFRYLLKSNNIDVYDPGVAGKPRPEKSDLALMSLEDDQFKRFQVKGITLKSSILNGKDSIIDIETQLSRGRINDHPTQSRLYYCTDFDYLILAIDPAYAKEYNKELYGKGNYQWEFYCFPQEALERHHIYNNRLKSHQILRYIDIQRYRINDEWLRRWK